MSRNASNPNAYRKAKLRPPPAMVPAVRVPHPQLAAFRVAYSADNVPDMAIEGALEKSGGDVAKAADIIATAWLGQEPKAPESVGPDNG